MATLTFAYDHSRDPMNPYDLADRIVTTLGLASLPAVDINPTQIIVTHANVTAGNTAAIQTLINSYVLDANRVADGPGGAGTIKNKARTAFTNNQTFLAIGSPTAADVTTQVQRLTRQVNALAKYVLGNPDDLTGT